MYNLNYKVEDRIYLLNITAKQKHQTYGTEARFEFLAAMSKIAKVFQNTTPCSLVDRH